MFQQKFAWLLVAIAGWNAAARAQEAPATAAGSLAAETREAAKNFQAVAPQDVAKAKARLADAVSQLDRFLRQAPVKAAGWKRYLQWNDLVGILQKDEAPDASLVDQLLSKFRAEHGGLELKQFTHVRQALADYAAAATAAADGKVKDEYAKQMEALATQLDAYAKDPANGDAALAIGETLGWLESNRQAQQLVSSIRRAYGQPNVYGYASQRFAAAGIEDIINKVQGVHDNILGTDLHGTARMSGRTTLVLDENPTAASMRILLGGMIYSNTVGYNGPVTIYSTGATSASGQKQIMMTAEGLLGYRAQASCRTSSHINDICARCGLIENIAWKRAGQQKGQAEAVASQHAAARVAAQIDRESAQLIADQNKNYKEKFRDPLVRRGEFPEELVFSSQSDRAMMRMRKDSAGRIAAPAGASELAGNHDLAVRAHESIVVNFSEAVLGGYEMTDVRLEKLIKDDLKGDLPEELRVTLPDGKLDPEKEPWSIIFSKELPARAKFNGGGLWMAIRADGFTRGEGDKPGTYKPALKELVEISAQYKIEKTAKGATLRRDGDVRIRFPNRANPDQIRVTDNATVTFMRRKFRSLFKEEFVGEGLKLKGRWERAGTLVLKEIQSDMSWLTLGWELPAKEAEKPAAGEE
jgi:hypothetical protein